MPCGLHAQCRHQRGVLTDVVPILIPLQTAKSFVIGDALMAGKLTPDEAQAVSAVETRFQCKRFGEVEWIHPLERAETKSRFAAAAIFFTLCQE
jgi:chaperone required for assembly of F1-ATPase